MSGLAMGYEGQVLLENIDFEIRRGEIFAILGGSGSGKSTLLRHLIGLEHPKAGTIRVHGAGGPLDETRPGFGVLFQSGALFGSMTVGENVALPLRHWTSLDDASIDAIVHAKLALVGLAGAESLLPAEISGGMKK
ncbi:MAG TPA: ATP-binding cassette domain-containing protein, partial [Myxococcota bacterium]|nr:ATP-binding cassette domain-containing protein [Myxococcota bacterium]